MSFASRMRTRSVTTVPMSNKNKIGNDGADQLWVENENENNGADDLGGANSTARSHRRVWGGVRSRLWVRRRRRLFSLSLSLSLSISLSLFARLTRKWFEVKIFTSNHFQGQSLILHGQLQIPSEKFIFHA